MRDRRMRVLLVLGALLVAGCEDETRATGGNSAMSAQDVTFASVGQGSAGWRPKASDFGPQVVVFHSRAAWEREQAGFPMTGDASGALASVDFDRQSLVAFTWGEIGSTGFSILLTAIEKGPPQRYVLTGTRPRPDEATGAMMTHPFHLVVLNATSIPKDAEFVLDGTVTPFETQVME